MQARQLPAQQGWQWLANGWRLFRQQPVGFLTFFFTYVFGVLFATLLLSLMVRAIGLILPTMLADAASLIGSLAFTVLIPGLSVGFMEACRAGERGQPILPQLLLKPLTTDARTTRALLMLGLLYACAVAIVLLLTSMPGSAPAPVEQSPGAPSSAETSPTEPTEPTASDQPADVTPAQIEQLGSRLALLSLAYLPVALAFWYAPVLVAWHGVQPIRAVFFSMVACWRNRRAFCVYGLAWLGFSILIPLVLGPFASLAGNPALAAFIVLPFLLIFAVVTYCSFYFTYTTVFDSGPGRSTES